MKKTSLPLNPPRPGPGQFSFEQFLEWAAANNKSPVPPPRFSPYAKPRRDNAVGKLMLPQKTEAAEAVKLTASPELEDIIHAKPWWSET